MTRPHVLEQGFYRIAFVLFLACTARFGWVVAHRTWARQNDGKLSEPNQPSTHLPTLAELQRQVSLPMLTPSAMDSAVAAALGSASAVATQPAPDYVKSYLSVQVGPPRAELRVDGVLVGRTPYVGQISCERGRTVRIDLLPSKGMPKEYKIPCLQGEMRLRDEP